MALKDTISKWHASICYLEEGQFQEAIEKFLLIKNPSAKIIYNVGCVHMLLDDCDQAVQHFCESINKDRYLVVAYFLRGVCYCWHQRFDLAQRDFSGILALLPEEGINYQQLGAAISLDVDTIKQWLQATDCARRERNALPPLHPIMDFIFRPPKKMVTSLQKEDFLGKAKVISSVQEEDIVYAAEKKTSNPPSVPRRPKFVISPSPPMSQPRQTKSRSRGIPPPPERKPPELTASFKDQCRRQWKSMEFLSDSRDESSNLSASSGRPSSQRLDIDDIPEYSHLTPADLQGSEQEHSYFSINTALSTSCPHIKVPAIKRPILPPRPRAPSSSNHTPQATPAAAAVCCTSKSSLSPSCFDGTNGRVNLSQQASPQAPGGTPGPRIPKKPPLAGAAVTPSESGQGSSKSVLTRAHPALFKGLHLPAGPCPAGRDRREPVQDMREGVGPGYVKQQPVSGAVRLLQTSNTNLNVQEKTASPKPARPPPPKIVR